MKEHDIESIFDKLGLKATAGPSLYTGNFGAAEKPKVEVVVSTTSNPFE